MATVVRFTSAGVAARPRSSAPASAPGNQSGSGEHLDAGGAAAIALDGISEEGFELEARIGVGSGGGSTHGLEDVGRAAVVPLVCDVSVSVTMLR